MIAKSISAKPIFPSQINQGRASIVDSLYVSASGILMLH
jgi:hypothetical protein